jgi:microcystin-dependent protein
MEPFIGQIMIFGFNFAPRGWAFCQGQLLSIAQNTALFSLLGTTYGGDGRTTFGLPDLRGRVPMGLGTGPGLSSRTIGQKIGTETTTLNVTQLPAHNHVATGSINASNEVGTDQIPTATANTLGGGIVSNRPVSNFNSAAPNVQLNSAMAVTVENAGGGQAFNNIQPSLVLNYSIALVGIFPSRS